jgi:hypothetical protein
MHSLDREFALESKPRRRPSTDRDCANREVGGIAEEVLQHLTTLPRADVKLTLEIEADAPYGVPDDVQRVVTENCQTLRFAKQGFESD